MIGSLLLWKKIILFIAALSIYAFLFTSNLRLLTTRTFTIQQQKRLNIGTEVGFSLEELRQVDTELVNFIHSSKTFPFITVKSAGDSSIPLFTKREIAHLYDTRNLLHKFFLTQRYSFVFLLLVFVLGRKRFSYQELFRIVSYTGMVIISVLVFLLVFIFTGFDNFFYFFHTIFFESGTWVFSSEEMLPRLFPDRFWMEAAIILLGIFTVQVMIVILFLRSLAKRGRRKRLEIKRINT